MNIIFFLDTSISILTLVQNVNSLANSAVYAEPPQTQHGRQRCLRFTPSCTEFKFTECVKKNTFAVDADGFRGSLGVLSIFYFLTFAFHADRLPQSLHTDRRAQRSANVRWKLRHKVFPDFSDISEREETIKEPFVFPNVNILNSLTQIHCLLSVSFISSPVRLVWEKKDGILKVLGVPATVIFLYTESCIFYFKTNLDKMQLFIIYDAARTTQQEQTPTQLKSIWRAVASISPGLGLNSRSSHPLHNTKEQWQKSFGALLLLIIITSRDKITPDRSVQVPAPRAERMSQAGKGSWEGDFLHSSKGFYFSLSRKAAA